MNFQTIKDITNFAGLTTTKQAENIAQKIVNDVKISAGYYFMYNNECKLWEERTSEYFLTWLFKFLDETGKQISDKIEGLECKKVEALLKQFDKSIYVNDISKRMNGLIQSKEFINQLNNLNKFLPIANGKKINLQTLEVTDRTKEDMFTFECSVNLVEQTPHADIFFSQIMPNEKAREYLRKILGYALTGETDARNFFVMYGNGSNGKSFVSTLMQCILGNYYVQCSDEVFQKSQSTGGASPHLASLQNKRFAFYSEGETADKMDLNFQVLKQISGEDIIYARHLYKDPINFKANCKLFLGTNFTPPLTAEKAIKDRLRYVFFDSVFSDNPNKGEFKKDEEFTDKLKTIYLDEIFTWIVNGAVQFYKDRKIEMPEEFQRRTNLLLMSEDSIESFLKNKITRTDNSKDLIRRKELFEAYKDYCNDNSQRCQPRSTLFNRMQHLKFESYTKDGYDVYRYIQLKDPSEQPANKMNHEGLDHGVNKQNDELIDLRKLVEEQKKQIEELKSRLDEYKVLEEPEKKPKTKVNKKKLGKDLIDSFVMIE